MKKKLLAVILAAVCVFSMTACGQSQEAEEPATEATEAAEEVDAAPEAIPIIVNSEPFTVQATDCDENGYALYSADSTGDFVIKSNCPNDVEWRIYVVDSPVQDELGLEQTEPTVQLQGNMEETTSLKEGQYIYVYTSHNKSQLGDAEVSKDVYITFDHAE